MSDVKLLVYDLSAEYGRIEWLTSWLPGPTLKGIWHTSLVLYGKEIDYGRKGVRIRNVGDEKDKPVQEYELGFTTVPYRTILGFAELLGRNTFREANYNVVKNNCHCFTNTMVKNILKREIPEYLRNLPRDVITAAIINSMAVASGCTSVQESCGVTKNLSDKLTYTATKVGENMTHDENVRR